MRNVLIWVENQEKGNTEAHQRLQERPEKVPPLRYFFQGFIKLSGSLDEAVGAPEDGDGEKCILLVVQQSDTHGQRDDSRSQVALLRFQIVLVPDTGGQQNGAPH